MSTDAATDADVENSEFYDLTVGGVAATGTITDDSAISVSSVTSDTQAEGNTLVHTVTLSGSSVNAETFSFSLADNTTESGDWSNLQFSDGVTLNAGVITVPAGVTSFTVSTDAATDMIVEGDEYYDLTVGGVAATGTITDANTLSADNAVSDDDYVNENLDGALSNITATGSISDVDSGLALSIDTSSATLASLTSNTNPVYYDWNSGTNTLTASTDSTFTDDAALVFTLVLDTVDDQYTFTQLGALDHPIANSEDDIVLPFTLVAGLYSTDFTVTVNDDVPEVMGELSIATLNDGNYSETGVLTNVVLSNDVTSIEWNTSSLPDLVFDGNPIVYVDDGNGTLTGQLADGTLIFRVVIDPTSVNSDMNPQYTFELLNEAGQLGQNVSETTYTVLSGGNIDNLVLGFGDNLINSITALDGSGSTATVNTNNGWVGVGGNWFNDGDILTMDFNNTDGSDAQVSQLDFLVEGQGSSAYTLNWTVTVAVDENGGYVTYSGSVNGQGNTDQPFSIPLQDGALYFTEVTIAAPDAGSDFRISFSGVTSTDFTSDIALDLGYTLTDSDNDTATGSVNVTLQGEADSVATLESTVGNDILVGSEGDDIFMWNSGDQGTSADPAQDTVKYFDVNDDTLDLSNLLDGLGMPDGGPVEDYLHIVDNGDYVSLTVQTGASGDVVQEIQLENVTMDSLTTHYGVSADQVLTSLIQDADPKIVI